MKYSPTAEAIKAFMDIKETLRVLDEALKEEAKKIREEEKRRGIENVVKNVREGVRSRSRETLPMMLNVGFIPTLSFNIAKATIKYCTLAESLIQAVKSSTEKLKVERVIDVLKKNEMLRETSEGVKVFIDDTQLSYAIYAYAIIKYLDEHLKLVPEGSGGSSLCDRTIQYLDALMEGIKSQVAFKLLRPYLEQFKRLCEAEFTVE